MKPEWLKEIEEIFELTRKQGLPIHPYHFRILLKALNKAYEAAERTIEMLQDDGFPSHLYSFLEDFLSYDPTQEETNV